MKPMARAEIDQTPAWLRWSTGALLAAYAALSVYLLWRSAVLSVFSDQFDWVNSVYGVRSDHRWLGYLLAPHNINRLVWTRLLVAWDITAFHGTNAPLIVSGALALGATAAMLSLQAARAATAPLKLPAAAIAAMLALTAGNVLDASTPIYVTYTHAAVFAVLALVLSEGAAASPFGVRGALAILCAVASAFGSGAGLALWPVMAWGALRRRDWPWFGLVALCGAMFVGAYLAGQDHGAGSAAAPALQDPRSAAILVLSYLTLPWTRVALHFAWIVGALVGAASLALAIAKGGADARPAQRVACGFILFTLTTAVMAGLGRSGASDPYNVPLRYGLLVAPLHTGLLMLALPAAGRLWREHRRQLQGGILAGLCGLLVLDGVFAAKAIAANDLIRQTVADFHAGLRTPRMLTLVYPSLPYAERMSRWMKQDGIYQHELHLKAPARPGVA